MDVFLSSKERIPHFDVVVVGSGSAGAVAAIAAGRTGARTLLIERYGFLGGTSTAVLDTFYGFYTPGEKARRVVAGVPDEVIDRLRNYGCCLERPNTYGAGTGITYNAEYLKLVWDELVLSSGAAILLHAWVQEVQAKEGRIESLTVATKSGLRRIEGAVFVDATGDGDLCFFAGSPCELAGEHEDAQSLTTTFRVANVDVAQRRSVSKEAFHRTMAEASASGAYRLPRREGSDHITPIKGMMATNMTRVRSYDHVDGSVRNAADPDLLTSAEIEGRRQAIEYFRFLRDKVPGYQDSSLVAFSTQIGVRETRRIFGQYRLTREDVLSARQFDDQIGLCGAPIEDHGAGDDTVWRYLPEGRCVGIPFRCLVPKTLRNTLVAGRCFSATHDAHASVRSMAQCMAMGQAAGTAAAVAVQQGRDATDLDTNALRQRLREKGAIVDWD